MKIKKEQDSSDTTPQPDYYYTKNPKALKVIMASNLSMGAKLMVFYLLGRAGGKSNCWPGQKTIATDLGICDRQVRNLLKELLSQKVIFWKRGAYNPKTKTWTKSNNYDLRKLMIGHLDDFSEKTDEELDRKMEAPDE